MFKTIKIILLSCLLSFSMAAIAELSEKADEIKLSAEQGDALGQAKLASLYLF